MPYLWLTAGAIAMMALALGVWHRPIRYWVLCVAGGAVVCGDVPAALMDLYVFRPGFLPDRRDHYIGCLSAELIFVPAYLVLLSAAPPKYRPLAGVLGVLISTPIEVLFLRLGVYDQHLWRTWVSTVLFGIVGLLLGVGASAVERRGYTPFFRATLVAGGLIWLLDFWVLIISAILRLEAGRLGLLSNPESDRVLSTILLLLVPTAALGFLVVWRGWSRHAAPLITCAFAIAAWLGVLQSTGAWHERAPWNPLLDGVLAAVIIVAVGRMDAWLSEMNPAIKLGQRG